MKVKAIPSAWLLESGIRLAARPYHSAAREALTAVRRLPTSPLAELTEGGKAGIFNGPRFSRTYVNDPRFGIPLLSGSDMLKGQVWSPDLISIRQASEMPEMILREGTSLISSYGTVGRTAYVRASMAGSVGSDNVMKVIPASDFPSPGYLFAYVSSRFGVPAVTVGVTGGTVPFLPPTRLYDLPVPRLGDDLEREVHNLVARAARERDQAMMLEREAGRDVLEALGWGSMGWNCRRTYSAHWIPVSLLSGRFDATYHDPEAIRASDLVAAGAASASVKDLGFDVLEAPRRKHVIVDSDHGRPFLNSGDIFDLALRPSRWVRATHGRDESSVAEGDILLARSGQVGGIIGTGVWADARFQGWITSPHILRVRTRQVSPSLSAYLFSFLCCTDIGYRLVARLAAGSSVPFIDRTQLEKLRVPVPSEGLQNLVREKIEASAVLRVTSQQLEDRAIEAVERAIEEAI